MGMAEQQAGKTQYDISIIRPQMRAEDFRLRGMGDSPQRLRAIRKGLRTLHTLELMAQTIYKFQVTRERSDLNCQLIAAMCNEMGHYQDFQIKLYEYGFRPSIFRAAYWIVGFVFGFGSRAALRRTARSRRMGRPDPQDHREGPGRRGRPHQPLEETPASSLHGSRASHPLNLDLPLDYRSAAPVAGRKFSITQY
jgi:hypothetical protein